MGTMGERYYIVGDEPNDYYLPDAVWVWAGFPDRNAVTLPISIIRLNATLDFRQIAAQIRGRL